MPFKDIEKRRAKNRAWSKNNRSTAQKIWRAYYHRHRDEINARRRIKYREQHAPEIWD